VVAESCTIDRQLRYDWVCVANYATACPLRLSDFQLPLQVQQNLMRLNGRRFYLDGQFVEGEGTPDGELVEESGFCGGRQWEYQMWVTVTSTVPSEANTLLLLGSGLTTLAGWIAWQRRRRGWGTG
jgi:hypothetical protein